MQGKWVAIASINLILIILLTYSISSNPTPPVNFNDASEFEYLEFGTYIGGSGYEDVPTIIMDKDNNFIIVGWTTSEDFPTKDAYDDSYNGVNLEGDIFVSKFDHDGKLIFSTFLGGSGKEFHPAVCTNNLNEIIVSGYTESSDFPLLNAYNSTYGGKGDAFISKFNSSGSLIYSTFVGGNHVELEGSVITDDEGNVASAIIDMM